jgi:ATP-binding cassette subfamily B protein
MFSGSIRQNIALTNPHLDLDAVIRAAQFAQIHEDIVQMPMGYETLIAPDGSLSGGQVQRLAIARTLANRPRLLILDEATSHLDTLTEARVSEALATLNCTRVIIAHRLSTVAGADRIFVMNGGRIVESGKHDALVALAGHYANMYIDQLGRDNL